MTGTSGAWQRFKAWRARFPNLFWLLLAVGTGIRLYFAFLPLSVLLVLLEDDAWMVTAIARNFALGRGITADGVNPTNGFHPLYPLTLGAIPYWIAPRALDGGFRANLVFCALIGAAAAFPLYRWAGHLAGREGALLAASVYLLSPYFARVTVNAMETALGLLLFLILLERFTAPGERRFLSTLGIGLLAGLAGLARLDNWLLAASLGLTLGWEAIRRRTRPAAFLAYTVGVAFLAVPYLAWNQAAFGSPMPSSGRALAYMHSYAEGFSLTNILHFLYLNPALHLGFLPSPWLALAFGGLLLLGYFWLIPSQVRRSLLPVAGAVFAQLLYYAYLQQNSNPRYFVAAGACFAVYLGSVIGEVGKRQAAVGRVLGIALSLLAVVLNSAEAIGTYRAALRMPELTQPTIYEAALWIRRALPPDAVLAAKNSGILQYYSDHEVLNIDGKLNADIVPVLERRHLLAYLRDKGVTYVVDRRAALEKHLALYSEEFGPWPAHSEIGLGQRLRIYIRLALSRLGVGEPPALDDPSGFRPARALEDVLEPVQAFPRPNAPDDPVIVYRLR
ncbi:MAG: glycosyltransferase family 39 protein [Chloroflexia bacterium]